MDDTVANSNDLLHLRRAIALAQRARDNGRHPFGALVIARSGEVLAAAENRAVGPDGDATGHAELEAVRAASRHHGPESLASATLYSSCEPCAMCAGAIYWSGIGRLVYGLSEERLKDFTGAHAENPTLSLPCREVFARGQRPVDVVGPLLEDEAAQPHAGFWT
jgi:tRNA(Arg) A34 adenosine deaminase TadA